MNLIHLLLALAALASSLFAGLMFTMLDIIQPILNKQSGAESAGLMQNIIQAGSRSRVLLVSMISTGLAGLVALALMVNQNWVNRAFWVAMAGWWIFVAASFVASRFAADPLYKTIMGWAVPPLNWREYRERWYQINLWRGLGAVAASVLFLVAILV
ncbi:MAG TPA: hypothetical protein VHO69_12380 [Phototrophicaceae bacterium]|nr:hypothetical protein [Phototrophicaceae bacterium]